MRPEPGAVQFQIGDSPSLYTKALFTVTLNPVLYVLLHVHQKVGGVRQNMLEPSNRTL